MASRPIIDCISGSRQTSSATQQILITITPPGDDLSIHVHWTAVGRESTSGEITTYEAIASFENTSGTMAQVGSTSILHEVDEDTNVVFAETATGANTITLDVTPAADTTDWSAWCTVTFLVV